MSSNGASTGTSQNTRALREERRKLLRKARPKHYCKGCLSVTFDAEERCLECFALRPDDGWTDLIEANDAWLGRTIDERYLITRPLGQGASAQVYRAESLSISRQFAVKIIATDKGAAQAEQIITRLNREIEALSRLRNPHIVSFYEILDIQGKFVAAVMDLINGSTLETLVNTGGPLSIGRACALLRQTANGLYEAHQAGMIHRDLKPENLMVERLPAGDDFVYVLDFGIVRLTDDNVSMTHGFIGTPLYASPEQAMAKSLDHRSDIYSLGAILFFMLTGRPPFLSNNVYDVLRMHVRQPPPRLGEVNKGRLYPRELEELLAAMLAKDPSQRPADLSKVIKTLDQLVYSSLSEAQSETNATQMGATPTIEPSGPHTPVLGVDAVDDERNNVFDDSPTSSATIQAYGSGNTRSASRQKAETPAFVRAPTPASAPPDERLKPIPAQIRFEGRTGSSTRNQALATSHPVPFELRGSPRDLLAAHGQSGDFAIMERDNGAEVQLFQSLATSPKFLTVASANEVTSLALSKDSLICGHTDGVISRVGLKDSKNRTLFQDVRRKPISAVAINATGHCTIAGSDSGRVYLHHTVRNSSSEWARIRDGESVRSLAINATADLIAIARQDNTIEIVSLSNTRVPVAQFRTSAPVRSMAISADNYLLAAAMVDHTVALFQLPTGHRLLSLRADKIDVLTVSFSSEGKPEALCIAERSLRRAQFEHLHSVVSRR